MDIKRIEFSSSYEEVEKLEPFLNSLQEDLGFSNEVYAKLMLSVSEAVTNGIVHGNKLEHNKKVILKAFEENGSLYFECTDEGNGFDPESVADPLEEENLLKPSGRGVFLMREYASDLSYDKKSGTLRLRFDLNS